MSGKREVTLTAHKHIGDWQANTFGGIGGNESNVLLRSTLACTSLQHSDSRAVSLKVMRVRVREKLRVPLHLV